MPNATVKKQLLDLEQERRRALVEEDFPRVAALFADDLVYVHTTGLVQGKADYALWSTQKTPYSIWTLNGASCWSASTAITWRS